MLDILRQGSDVEVLAPEELKIKVKKALENAIKLYK
jgi:predicted DNA-binding transcriptional regulator YafY